MTWPGADPTPVSVWGPGFKGLRSRLTALGTWRRYATTIRMCRVSRKLLAEGQRRERGDCRPLRRAPEHPGQRNVQARPPRLRAGHGAPEAQEGGDRVRRVR